MMNAIKEIFRMAGGDNAACHDGSSAGQRWALTLTERSIKVVNTPLFAGRLFTWL